MKTDRVCMLCPRFLVKRPALDRRSREPCCLCRRRSRTVHIVCQSAKWLTSNIQPCDAQLTIWSRSSCGMPSRVGWHLPEASRASLDAVADVTELLSSPSSEMAMGPPRASSSGCASLRWSADLSMLALRENRSKVVTLLQELPQ